jgi:uncharacterized protein (DUF427 family)
MQAMRRHRCGMPAPSTAPHPAQPTARSAPRTEVRLDRTAKRIRVFFAGELLADSIVAHLGYTTGRHPEYLLPTADVTWDHAAVDDTEVGDSPFGRYHPLRAVPGGRAIGRRYTAGHAKGMASFDFELMDAWYEEDEQIWFHARDPFRRVEVIESSRLIEVTVNGRMMARSSRPRLVTETGLPERWYIPRIDVDWTYLASSTTTSGCQYKGLANWWHVCQDGSDQLADVVWGYERPVPEANKLTGLVAFYAEHAAVETSVDGVIQPKPVIDSAAINPSLNVANAAV